MKRFAKDQSGATSIEYAVIAMLIGIAIIAAVIPIGETLKANFEDVEAGFTEED